MIDTLLQPEAAPFTVALCLMLVIAVVELGVEIECGGYVSVDLIDRHVQAQVSVALEVPHDIDHVFQRALVRMSEML